MDLLIQRLLEVPSAAQQYLIRLLECFKDLYKYHGGCVQGQSCDRDPVDHVIHPTDQPVTFLYFTLHYYNDAFTHHPEWKLFLTSCVIGPSPHTPSHPHRITQTHHTHPHRITARCSPTGLVLHPPADPAADHGPPRWSPVEPSQRLLQDCCTQTAQRTATF